MILGIREFWIKQCKILVLIWGRNLPTSSDAVYLFSIIETTDFVSLFIKNFTSVNREGEIQTLGKRQAQNYEERNLLKLNHNKKRFFSLRGRSQLTFTRFVFFWPPTPLRLHFLWYKSLQKAGLLMGDDIETCRSTGCNYWAALHWLRDNQNKRP